MAWHYRVIHTTEPIGEDGAEEDVYRVVEVFHKGGQPEGWGEASVQGESVGEIRGVLARMAHCLSKPVIDVCAECHNIAPAHKPDCSKLPKLTL